MIYKSLSCYQTTAWSLTLYQKLKELHCAERVQTSTRRLSSTKSDLGFESGFLDLDPDVCGSLPRCCGFITLSTSVVLPSVVKIGQLLYEKW